MSNYTIDTGLEYGWYDKDHIMEVVIIKLLCDFFENELDPEEENLNPGRFTELRDMYNYFSPLRDGKNIPWEPAAPEAWKIFNDNLLRVVQLRGLLWT